jgi:DNA adenine methylase
LKPSSTLLPVNGQQKTILSLSKRVKGNIRNSIIKDRTDVNSKAVHLHEGATHVVFVDSIWLFLPYATNTLQNNIIQPFGKILRNKYFNEIPRTSLSIAFFQFTIAAISSYNNSLAFESNPCYKGSVMARSSTTYCSKWKSSKTTVIRVPVHYAREILRYAHELDDAEGNLVFHDPTVAYRTAADFEMSKPVNVASVPHRSPFRYPGGKTWLVPYIRSWLAAQQPRFSVLIEPFAGGGIVGLTAGFENLADNVVLIERDSSVAAVWRTIFGGQANWLANRILGFHMSRANVNTVFQQASETQREKAFAVILRNRVQRGGIMAPGAGLIKSGENGRGLLSRWYPETLARRIREIAMMQDRFMFIEDDGFEIIRRYADDEGAAFFVDPPYTIASRRLYPHWKIDHRNLFTILSKIKGDILLTYDNTDEISSLASEFGFETKAIAMKNTHHARKTELLIGKDLSWLKPGANGRGSATRIVQETLAFRR